MRNPSNARASDKCGPSIRLAGILALAIAAASATVRAQDAKEWVGKRVILQFDSVLRVGNQVVDNQKRETSGRGGERATTRIYRVEQINGPWLWIKAENQGMNGWIKAAEVIPYDQAIEYFTNQIRVNPAGSSAYNSRAGVWKDKKEYDIAIADYNEAIRFDPGSEAFWNNRGTAYYFKKEHDKAIADYTEAIRLDPNYAMPYNNRGIAWDAKKEYDKAIADYNEAIRLDPKYTWTYDRRGRSYRSLGLAEKALRDFATAIELDPKDSWGYNNNAFLWATFSDEKFRDGKKAVEAARKACELSNERVPEHFGTLAAAHAEAGDFAKAIKFQTKANAMYDDADDKKKGEERLKLYQDKTPYREVKPWWTVK